jgi:uncharacterized protein YecT (DUF1311 family)
MKKHILFLSCLVLLIFSSVCHGENSAGFDCKKANTTTEKLICNDFRLSSEDRLLTSTYLTRLKFLSQEEKKNLKAEQIAWLKKRDQVCGQTQDKTSISKIDKKLLKYCEPKDACKPNRVCKDTKPNSGEIDEDCLKKICLKKIYEGRLMELELKIPGLVRFENEPVKDLELTIIKSKQLRGAPEFYYRLSDHEYLFPVDGGKEGGRLQLGLYYADTKNNKLNQIISGYLIIEGVIKGNDVKWLIVYHTDLNRGFSTNGYNAILIKDEKSNNKPYQLFDLASIASPYIEEDYGEDNPCAYISDSQKKIDNSFSELKGYDVKDLNGDGINDMVFRIERYDCKTNKHSSIIETYFFLSKAPYIEKKEQKK